MAFPMLVGNTNVTVILLLCQYWILSIVPQALSISKEFFKVQCSDFTSKEKNVLGLVL